MHRSLVFLSVLLLFALVGSARAASPWTPVDTGLDYGVFTPVDEPDSPIRIAIVRIDPTYYDFSLHTVSEEGGPALSLDEWASRHELAVLINASMYLPDVRSSTGYMRNGDHLNNPRIGTKLGSFFVAGPDSTSLPRADLLDRTVDPWETIISHYRVVVQNYRLVSNGRRILWAPGGPLYSIAAIGQDAAGSILFIHCREPITAYDFANILLGLPINIHDVAYVEGGPQAGLMLRTPATYQAWAGRHRVDFWSSGNPKAPLPNVIGVRRRALPDGTGLFPRPGDRPLAQP